MKVYLRGWRPGGQLVQTPQRQREGGGRGSSGGRRRRSGGPGWWKDKTWRGRVREDVGRREAWRREVQGRESEMSEAVAAAVAVAVAVAVVVVVGKEAW